MTSNALTRLQNAPVRTRKIVLWVSTALITGVIVSTWVLTTLNNQNQPITAGDKQPSSAFAIFENSFFRKNVHYTR